MGSPVQAGRSGDPDREQALYRDVLPAQDSLEAFVLERGEWLEAAYLLVEFGREAEGGARELPVLCCAPGSWVGEKTLVTQASLLGVPAPDVRGQRAVVGEIDAAADGPRPPRQRPELGGEPIRCHHRVGVGACDEALRSAHAQKAGARGIHPDPACRTGTFARTIE